MERKRIPLYRRFYSKFLVDDASCWKWQAATNANGYGVIGAGLRGEGNLMAHRVSWELHHGPIPGDALVLHHCDVPRCVNPTHLFLGTQKDNMSDCVKKNRISRKGHSNPGLKNGHARVTPAMANEIRDAYSGSGATQRTLAHDFGINQATICRVLSGKHWTSP